MFFWMDSNTVSSLRTSPATNKGKPNQTKNQTTTTHTHTEEEKKKTKHKAQVNLPEMFTYGTDVTTTQGPRFTEMPMNRGFTKKIH